MSLSGVRAYVASGLQGPAGVPHEPQGVTNLAASRILQERGAIEGDSPVRERGRTPRRLILSTTGHANPVGSREAHLPRLNTPSDR